MVGSVFLLEMWHVVLPPLGLLSCDVGGAGAGACALLGGVGHDDGVYHVPCCRSFVPSSSDGLGPPNELLDIGVYVRASQARRDEDIAGCSSTGMWSNRIDNGSLQGVHRLSSDGL